MENMPNSPQPNPRNITKKILSGKPLTSDEKKLVQKGRDDIETKKVEDANKHTPAKITKAMVVDAELLDRKNIED